MVHDENRLFAALRGHDIVQIHVKRPLVQAYMAVIDLRNPQLEIKLGATLDKKSLTSAFARENDCSVAINGEAGNSPGRDSGLGEWRGHMVRLAQVVLREDPEIPAPLLAFDPETAPSSSRPRRPAGPFHRSDTM